MAQTPWVVLIHQHMLRAGEEAALVPDPKEVAGLAALAQWLTGVDIVEGLAPPTCRAQVITTAPFSSSRAEELLTQHSFLVDLLGFCPAESPED